MWMFIVGCQFSGLKYSFSRGWWRGEIVADDNDEVRTTVKAQICEVVKWVEGTFCSHLDFTYGPLWLSKLLSQDGGKRWRGVGSLLISARWKVGRREEIDGHYWIIDGPGWISELSQTFIQWYNQTRFLIFCDWRWRKIAGFLLHPDNTLHLMLLRVLSLWEFRHIYVALCNSNNDSLLTFHIVIHTASMLWWVKTS